MYHNGMAGQDRQETPVSPAKIHPYFLPVKKDREVISLQPKNTLIFEDGFQIRVRSEDRPPSYTISHVSLPDIRDEQGLAQVPFYSVSLFLCAGACVLEDGEWFLRPFDILFLPPDTPYSFTAGEENARQINVLFLPAPPGSPFEGDNRQILSLVTGSGPVYRLPAEDMKALFSCLNGIYNAASEPSSLRDLTVHLEFSRFLLALCSSRERNTYVKETSPGPSARKMRDVAAYIRRHYAEPLTLADIAAKFYVSSFYLSHQFRAVIGATLSDFIRGIRIRNVQTLLVTTSVSITEAAMRCGFTSFSQFNRCFRAVVGMSPSQYRRLMAPDRRVPAQKPTDPKDAGTIP
ncbi:MAG: helix-turn-helix transcriptional regulator [Clostridia bacterium]|nr:helix-turn-helix transcriptional regulator [Clostridia bacterium]